MKYTKWTCTETVPKTTTLNRKVVASPHYLELLRKGSSVYKYIVLHPGGVKN